MALPFPAHPFRPRRRWTREVRIGDVGVGGTHPLRIQSMTTTPTLDTRATCDQVERLADAGCEIVRVTVPSIRDAESLREMRVELARRKVRVPLVADIHYTPNAALVAAEHVEKVRVNPGNYADKKKFEVREYTEAQYAEELERVAGRFRPLVRRCRELGRALRIGTNHGSLSDRIMNRYGDTSLGMVESALEFLAVCEEEGFADVVFSMKASNPQVAIQAYRLLAARLAERAPDAPSEPFHVGVTEAGDGADARVKSAIGIGSLLEDGIGDTIRVSLTEDPVREVPVCRALADRYDARWREDEAGGAPAPEPARASAQGWVEDPYAHARRPSTAVVCSGLATGADQPVRVELGLGRVQELPDPAAEALAGALARAPGLACEGFLVEARDVRDGERAAALAEALAKREIVAPLAVRASLELAPGLVRGAARWLLPVPPGTSPAALARGACAAQAAGVALEWCLEGEVGSLALDAALDATPAALRARLLVSVDAPRPVHAVRWVAARLRARAEGAPPIVLRHRWDARVSESEALLAAAVELGAPLCDGLGDAVRLEGVSDAAHGLELAYRILQGARQRTSWTEFISCPSCGRTLFDLEETTERIRSRTRHLSGVKIAIMGCIVNGPGEMADADFGYVGSGPARVNLYVGKQLVERNVPQEQADDRLVELIRRHGRWVEPA